MALSAKMLVLGVGSALSVVELGLDFTVTMVARSVPQASDPSGGTLGWN